MSLTTLMIAAAEHERAVVDAFRRHDALSADRARPLAELAVARDACFEQLRSAGVVVAGPAVDTWYLNEAAYIERRDARPPIPYRRLAVLLVLLALVIAFLFRGPVH